MGGGVLWAGSGYPTCSSRPAPGAEAEIFGGNGDGGIGMLLSRNPTGSRSGSPAGSWNWSSRDGNGKKKKKNPPPKYIKTKNLEKKIGLSCPQMLGAPILSTPQLWGQPLRVPSSGTLIPPPLCQSPSPPLRRCTNSVWIQLNPGGMGGLLQRDPPSGRGGCPGWGERGLVVGVGGWPGAFGEPVSIHRGVSACTPPRSSPPRSSTLSTGSPSPLWVPPPCNPPPPPPASIFHSFKAGENKNENKNNAICFLLQVNPLIIFTFIYSCCFIKKIATFFCFFF